MGKLGKVGSKIEKVVRGEVTLWLWHYREQEVLYLEGLSGIFLNREEQLRLDKIVSVGRRADYLVGRWLVKKVKEDGRYYSISHSEGVVVLAVANGYLGVDIERQSVKKQRKHNGKNREKLIARFFSEEENLAYLKCQEDEQDYFLKVWTKKEAYYKYLSNREDGNPNYSRVSFFKLMGVEIANSLNQERLEVDTFFIEKYACMVSVVTEKINFMEVCQK